jgi:hypothetical protein
LLRLDIADRLRPEWVIVFAGIRIHDALAVRPSAECVAVDEARRRYNGAVRAGRIEEGSKAFRDLRPCTRITEKYMHLSPTERRAVQMLSLAHRARLERPPASHLAPM